MKGKYCAETPGFQEWRKVFLSFVLPLNANFMVLFSQQARAHETNSKSEEIASLRAVIILFMCLLFSLNYKENLFLSSRKKKKLSLLLDPTTMMRIGELTSSSCSLLTPGWNCWNNKTHTVRKTLNIFLKCFLFILRCCTKVSFNVKMFRLHCQHKSIRTIIHN